MKINLELAPESKVRTTLPVNDKLSLPLWILQGAKPGPTLVVTAGVHGCEYVGIQTARTLYNHLEPKTLKGRVLILPLMNAEGFHAGARQLHPSSGQNLNRVFPGKEDGTVAEQIAYVIEKEIYPHADFLLDLHGADWNESIEPLVFFPIAAKPEVNEASRAATLGLPVGYRIPSTEKNGLYSHASQCGIPSLLLEMGELGKWSDSEVDHCIACVEQLMRHLEMIKIGAGPHPDQKEALESVYEEAEQDGFWVPKVKKGAPIKEGETLGTLSNLEGETLQTVTARFDGIVWYYTTGLGVRAGDPLVAYGRVE